MIFLKHGKNCIRLRVFPLGVMRVREAYSQDPALTLSRKPCILLDSTNGDARKT